MTPGKMWSGVRIIIVFFASIGIWLLTMRLFGGHEFANNVILHIFAGLFLSTLVCALIIAMLRIEKQPSSVSLKKTVLSYLKDFGLGFLCWLIPATMCIFILTITGQVLILVQAPPSSLIVKFLALLVAVFFIEAFPEEIIRGYLYSLLEESFAQRITLLIQTILFTLFAFAVGSLYSTEQWLFIPGFGFLLGYYRMLSGSILFSMGFHTAIMTFTQLMTPMRQLIEVNGNLFLIRVLAFVLIPAILSSTILHFKKTT